VKDANGNVVPVTSAKAYQGGRERSCDLTLEGYACRDLQAGDARVEVIAAGQTFQGETTLSWQAGSEGCHTALSEIDFLLPGAGCPAMPTGSAVRGSLFERGGAPAALDAAGISLVDSYSGSILSPDGWQADCTVDGASFECPSLVSYAANYRVYLHAGYTQLSLPLTIDAVGCVPSTQDLLVRPEELACPDEPKRAAVMGSVWVRSTDQLLTIDGARARLGDGEFMACTLSNERREFSCPVQGQPGSGVYEVEVVSAGTTYTRSLEVIDDGCNVFTAGFYVELDE
jgi:hypothetical protein